MKVLFVGNSFTARNDLPGMIANLADAIGERFDHRLISVGGASLRTHWNKGEARRAIKEGGYDHVVLQEQSTLPVKNATRMLENVKLFDAVIRAAAAKPVLYMTWARLSAPETQRLITSAYAKAAKDVGATMIEAGMAWSRLLEKRVHPVLHDRDGSHPTVAGTYLAACCAFATFYNRSPVGLPAPESLSAADAALLQRAASARRCQV